MATTKIWAIHDSLVRVVGYAENPEKTGCLDFDIANVLHYATDEEKTTVGMDEKKLFVTSINCDGNAAQAMLSTQKHFGKTDGNVAYHAYQSFAPGEVTPEQCHEIGVKLAKKMWGEKYQVVVASHLDHDHLHNHFVICSVSFRDGKKYDCNKREYAKLRRRSDELCYEYGLSVIEQPKRKTPRQIHFAERAGDKTKYSLISNAIQQSLKISASWEDFCHHLHDLGYDFDPNFNGKYAKIKRIREQKWTRVYQLSISRRDIEEQLQDNAVQRIPNYQWYYFHKRRRNGYYRYDDLSDYYNQLSQLPLLLCLVCLVIYLAGGPDYIGNLAKAQEPQPKYTPLTPEMQEARRFLQTVSRQAVIMGREKLGTKEDVDAFLDRLEGKIVTLERRRKDLYNSIRRCTDEDKCTAVKGEIHRISAELKCYRREQSDMSNLLERSGVLAEQVQAEEKARRQKIAREYFLPDELAKRWKNDLTDDYISPIKGNNRTATQRKQRARDEGR